MGMKQIIRISLTAIILLVLSSCNIGAPAATFDTPVLRLTVQMENGINTFIAVNQVVNYRYNVTNAGTAPLPGQVTVIDAPRQVTCPNVNTVGNLDNSLDLNESLTCTAPYTITQADFDTGSVTNIATASIGGQTSNQSGVTLTKSTAQTPTLTLTKTANPTGYGKVGDLITYNYIITNTGTTPLGPAQFTISDNKFPAVINCGLDQTTIAAGQTLPCSAIYTITAADLSSANLTNIATASGAGQKSAEVTTTVTNSTITQTAIAQQTLTPSPPSNLTPGSTIVHPVAVGEWLIQIARCYGASFADIRNANPQITDPDLILPAMSITVPRIGSAGRIYGPPCITFYTAQSGDTWNSIAQQFNACVAVLQRVNPVSFTAGTSIKVPRNSAGLYCPGSTSPGPAITATSTPTGTVSAPQRITFDPGQTTARRIGLVKPNETIHYVFTAAAGQQLTIQLGANLNEVAIGVKGPTGLTLKELNAVQTWNTTVLNSGDHFIDIASILGSSEKSYTLDVTLVTPGTGTATVTPTPTSTATPTPTTPAPQ